MSKKNKLFVALALVGFGVAGRLLPHLWNAAPIAAIALFAGVYLGRNYALILPPVAMLAGDLFLGFYRWPLALAVYFSLMIIGLIGYFISQHKDWKLIAAASLTGSVIFFLATNWAVWQFSSWYPHSLSGLYQCYLMALPFFRNTLVGDLFYNGVLFGVYELVNLAAPVYKLHKVKIGLGK